MMKIFHVADTHLGYTAYRKVRAETGLNRREEDVYSAFQEFVEIAIKEKPDLILHAGDLFDSVRPSNRTIAFAMEQLLLLSSADIPTVIISGNHETPRLRETGSIFKVFEHIPGIYPVYRQRSETVSFDIGGKNVEIFALPHMGSEERFREEMEKMRPVKKKFNIAVLHGSLVGLDPGYLKGDFNEIKISGRILTHGFDYIALGHFHDHTVISGNCAYSGATERFSFSEAGKAKGFIELTVSDDEAGISFRELSARDMVDLGVLDVKNLNTEEVHGEIEKKLGSKSLDMSIARLKIINVAKEVYGGLDHVRLDKLTEKALHFQFRWTVSDEVATASDFSHRFRGLVREFHDFLDKTIEENLDRDKLKEMGTNYLLRAGVKD